MLQCLFWVQLLLLGYILNSHFQWLTISVAICLVILLPVLLWAAAQTLRQGYAPARPYLFAWGFLGAGVMYWLAGQNHLIPHNIISFYGPMIGSAFEMLLLSLAVFDRMSRIERELLATQESITRTLETKVRERTRELEFQRAATLHASKMSTLGEMAGGVAHEINNPLAIIRIHSARMRELLKADRLDLRPLSRCLEQTDLAVVRISLIIRSLLSFAKSDDEAPARVHAVSEIIEQTLQLCREDFERKGIQLTIWALSPELKIECRESQVRQVLFNLLANAADAVAGQTPSWISLAIREEREGIQFEVTDSGPGLPEKIRERIFEPFFTTKGVGRGPGLGLSVAKGIAESHGGELWLDAESVKTRFVLWIPKTKDISPRKALEIMRTDC